MKLSTDRFTRVVVMVWVVAGVIIATLGFRALMAIGFISWVSPTVPASCRPIALAGAGDLAWENKSKTLFIAARDGLYAIPEGRQKPVKLSGTPKDFHPAALSIGYDLGGEPALAVVDRRADGSAAMQLYRADFDAKGPKLIYQSTITGGLARRAQGVAMLGNERFYVTANPTRNDLMAWADRWLLLGRANLLFFNGSVFGDAVGGLSDPSGVVASPDGRFIYVVSRNERRLIAFSREPFGGTLTELDSISLPMRPERISIDASNVLWVAGPVRLPSMSGASNVVRVFLDGEGKPQSSETVYAGDGIVAATAAVKGGNTLYIGSGTDEKILACELK
jgi:hypothetical protein